MTQQGTIRNVQVSRRIWRIPCVNRTIWTVARAVWNFFENLPWASSIWLFWGGQNVGKMWTFVLQIIILTVTQYGKETGKKKWGPNHLLVFFSGVSKLPICRKCSKINPPPQKKQFLTFKSSYLPCFSIKFRNSFWRIPIKGILITGNLKNWRRKKFSGANMGDRCVKMTLVKICFPSFKLI